MVAILGIGGYSHDSAACLLVDGELVAAAMEERFTRRKHQGGIPYHSVEYCLREGGLAQDELDHVGMYMNPWLRLKERLPYRLKTFRHSPRYSTAYFLYELLHNLGYIRGARSLCGPRTKLHYLEHHLMHAASSHYSSPFEQSVILTIDYIGEFASTVAAIGEGNRLTKVWEQTYPHSLGVVYSAMTDYLGFRRANDEYKVMGLAAYGDPSTYIDVFRDMIQLGDGLDHAINLSYFQYHYLPGSRVGYVSPKLLELLGPKRQRESTIEQRHMDIAAALQLRLEECVLQLVHVLHQRYPDIPHLCLGGGVALNSVMNGRILEEGPFEKLYIQPAAGDDGIAIGAAQHLYYNVLDNDPTPFFMKSALLGPSFSDEEIEADLQELGVSYRRVGDAAAAAAERIVSGKIVGWFQDRMEFGPRALGARSILADPTRADMQDILNDRVKHREDFRPFAPAVCSEDFDTFFAPARDGLPADDVYPHRFMLLVSRVRESAKERIPAVTHVDGTARVQTVYADQSPLYYRMIREVEKRNGIPVVINTSFNVRGEPIVCRPADAVRCFLGTGIDILYAGPFEITKPAEETAPPADPAANAAPAEPAADDGDDPATA